MNTHYYIACDMDLDSSRVILGRLDNGRLGIEEIYQFPNNTVCVGNFVHSSAARMAAELKAALGNIAARGVKAASLSVSLREDDSMLFNNHEPSLVAQHQYRDTQSGSINDRVKETAGSRVSFEEKDARFIRFNTLHHIITDLESDGSLPTRTGHYLNIARIVTPGTKLGSLKTQIADETGLASVAVIATCPHYSGDAITAVPAKQKDNWAFLSSGTRSLIGVELTDPLVTEKIHIHTFSNEAGLGGTTRFLKNLAGIWILQECRRSWGGNLDLGELSAPAEEEESFRSLIDPNDSRFLQPGDVPEKIAAYCRETGQHPPDTQGRFIRCILESLALSYRQALDEIEAHTGRTIHTLHIVGNGCKIGLLNQLAASATGRTVVAGPVEASAIGNLLTQGVTLGHIESPEALRNVVRESFPLRVFLPRDAALWRFANKRFSQLRADT